MNFSELATKEIQEVFEILATREQGLTEKEAREREKQFGLNEIKEKGVSAIEIWGRQFRSVFFFLLFSAGIIAFFLGEKIDAALIIVFAFFNVILGFSQEFKAQKALSLLKDYFPPDTNVIREGKEKIIDKKFLVPGDIVVLDTGDIVPADLRILEVNNLLVDESILTGESEPVFKVANRLAKAETFFEAKNILFSGSSLVSGKAKGVVISTGKDTEIGKIGKFIAQLERPSVYEKEIADFSKIILRFVLFTIILIFLANLLLKKQQDLGEFLLFCLALIVGIVPEALPVVVGTSLANGALKLAKRNVLVKRLTAIEDLGNIEILCTDKTGTITEDKLILAEVFAPNEERCLEFAFLGSSLLEKNLAMVKNPFDLAINERFTEQEKLREAKIIFEIPFSPQRLRNSVLVEYQGKKFLVVRGAPEKVLELVKGVETKELLEKVQEQGRTGKRALAIAMKEFDGERYQEEDECELEWLGFLFFVDPLKKETKATLNLATKLGVKVKILTGDAAEVAGQVGKAVGLIENETEVISGKELEKLSPEAFAEACERYSVFARVLPETKLKIIQTLQKKYEVGFVGEGINDAPALKIANVAIVVKKAAEVSKEVADIILLKDDLKTIIEGIKRGRNIFSNIQKYIKATLSSNFGNMYSMAGISLIFPFLPLLPVQLLLLNLLTDLPLVAVATDSLEAEELKRPKTQRFSQLFLLIFLFSLVSSLFDFLFFGTFFSQGERVIQTHWFLFSVLTEIFILLSVRTRKFFLKASLPSPILVGLASMVWIISLVLPFTTMGQERFHFVPPTPSSLLNVFLLAIGYLFANEIMKFVYLKTLAKREN